MGNGRSGWSWLDWLREGFVQEIEVRRVVGHLVDSRALAGRWKGEAIIRHA